jgi:hypothetical protein
MPIANPLVAGASGGFEPIGAGLLCESAQSVHKSDQFRSSSVGVELAHLAGLN